MEVSLTRNKKIIIKKVKAIECDCKIENNKIVTNVKNKSNNIPITIDIEMENNSYFSSINITNTQNEYPIQKIQLFISKENKNWEKISLLNTTFNNNNTNFQTPLIECNEIQIVLSPGQEIKKNTEFIISFSNTNQLSLSSNTHSDRLWVIENLIDLRDDYGWSSDILSNLKEEIIKIDLNRLYLVNSLKLRSVKDKLNNFPVKFTISVSYDNILWEQVASEENFYVGSFHWYIWKFTIKRIRYIKINILEHQQIKKGEYCSKILDLDILAVPENNIIYMEPGNITQNIASELVAGVVKLAENNSSRPGHVVQASDARLKNASTEYYGISKLARNGEKSSGVAVQGNDFRLRPATVEYPGICKLAKDGEELAKTVVQGNDSRLNHASTDSYGISRLAEDGETRPGAAVQGDDSRLKRATEKEYGISKLASDNESKEGVVIQGNDSRLRAATENSLGIVQFSAHGEKLENRAVQSDDPRLEDADTERKGKVVFAKDSESFPLKAIQANDSRLTSATTKKSGITKLANHGVASKGYSVQADDPRLTDARIPLEHYHNYAEKEHLFNDHTGDLNIKVSKKTNGSSIEFSESNNFPLSVINEKGLAVGINGGLHVHSDHNSSITTSSKKHIAIEGYSKEKPASSLFSEHDYALILPNNLNDLKSSGKSIMSEGLVTLNGGLEIAGSSAIVVKWYHFLDEAYSDGDLLTVDSAGKIQKIKANDQNCIGVYVKDPKFVVGDTLESKPSVTVAVAGIVRTKIQGVVNAGERIAYANSNPGVGKKSSKGLGPLISLESSDEQKEKLIWCVFRN